MNNNNIPIKNFNDLMTFFFCLRIFNYSSSILKRTLCITTETMKSTEFSNYLQDSETIQ